MGWGEYARSKIPLKLVFISLASIAVNLIIIGAFQLVAVYRFKAPIDEAALARMNSRYENCTILDTEEDTEKDSYLWGSDYTAYLLETANGQLEVAVVEQHPLFQRFRYLKKLSAPVPEATDDQGIWVNNCCMVSNQLKIQHFYAHSSSSKNGYFLLIFAMCVVEYVGFVLLFRRDEIM